jgi:formylglycine-generating enzyme required for sulfatase activity
MRPRRVLPVLALLALAGFVTVADLTSARPQDPPARKPRKVALLVGPSTYLHDFGKLNYTARDVEALAVVLRDGGFDEVVVLTDPPEGKNPATRANVLDRLEKLVAKQPNPANNVRQGDVVMVVLSGHGLELDVPDPEKPGKTRREAFFAPVDGNKGKPDTLVSLGHLVNDVLAPCGGRNLLLVDACREIYDPNKGRGIGGRSVSLTGQTAVLFSCSTGELSFEADEVKHGVFTHAVLEVAKEVREAGRPLSWAGLIARVEERMGTDAVKKLIPAGQTQTPVLAAGQVPATELLASRDDAARELAPGERLEEFEYVVEGGKRKGKRRVLAVDLGGGQTMEFVRIPKGTFLMGSPDGEKDADANEKPQRRVEVTRDFYLGKYEVMQAQYKAVTGASPSRSKGDRLPVEAVSWNDSVAFCEALSKKVKRTVHLPTEVQWEYACRAGTTTPFHFGSRLNGDLANSNRGLMGKTADVGSYPANPWGLHDMHGNVYEWCRDYYGPYDKVEGVNDPIQLTKQSENIRIIRGGNTDTRDWVCRSARRGWHMPDRNDLNNCGFRVCLPLD